MKRAIFKRLLRVYSQWTNPLDVNRYEEQSCKGWNSDKVRPIIFCLSDGVADKWWLCTTHLNLKPKFRRYFQNLIRTDETEAIRA